MKSKELKRQEAQERQMIYEAMTPDEKWEAVVNRPGNSEREARRLNSRKDS